MRATPIYDLPAPNKTKKTTDGRVVISQQDALGALLISKARRCVLLRLHFTLSAPSLFECTCAAVSTARLRSCWKRGLTGTGQMMTGERVLFDADAAAGACLSSVWLMCVLAQIHGIFGSMRRRQSKGMLQGFSKGSNNSCCQYHEVLTRVPFFFIVQVVKTLLRTGSNIDKQTRTGALVAVVAAATAAASYGCPHGVYHDTSRRAKLPASCAQE